MKSFFKVSYIFNKKVAKLTKLQQLNLLKLFYCYIKKLNANYSTELRSFRTFCSLKRQTNFLVIIFDLTLNLRFIAFIVEKAMTCEKKIVLLFRASFRQITNPA